MLKLRYVYGLKNKITGDLYVGSTSDLKRRFDYHAGNTESPLHEHIKKYGRQNFDMVVLEEYQGDKWDCSREKVWIQKLKPSYNKQTVSRPIQTSATWLCSQKDLDSLMKKTKAKSKSYALQIAVRFYLDKASF